MAGIHIVFDGPPGPEGPRFIEVEDENGQSITVGTWEKKQGEADNWHSLHITELPRPKVPHWEIHDAEEAAQWLRSGATIRWAPGDATLYRLTLVDADSDPVTGRALLVFYNDGRRGQSPILLLREKDGYSTEWNAKRWSEADCPPGAYGGIMPVLAALGWAGDRSPKFDSRAWQELVEEIQ